MWLNILGIENSETVEITKQISLSPVAFVNEKEFSGEVPRTEIGSLIFLYNCND